MTSKTLLRQQRQPNSHVIKLLCWLRSIGIVLQIAVLFAAAGYLNMTLNMPVLSTIVAAQVVWNLRTWARLRKKQRFHSAEVTLNLTIDLFALAGLFYFTGGSTNPFISVFIVPVALSAVFSSLRSLTFILTAAIGLYTALLKWYEPLPHVLHHQFGDSFHLHVIGMWANFLFSAVIIAAFIYVLAYKNQKYQLALSESREKLLRNQHILNIGMLAAGSAHELNTHLANIGLLADELQTQPNDQQTKEDINEISKQVDLCKDKILKLQGRLGDSTAKPFATALSGLLGNWLASRPEIKLRTTIAIGDEHLLTNELSSVLVSLLDNAADASVQNGQAALTISAYIKNHHLTIDIDDSGRGLTDTQMTSLGKEAYSDKDDGMGLGLILSHASLEQLGGTLQLAPIKPNGTRARVRVPV